MRQIRKRAFACLLVAALALAVFPASVCMNSGTEVQAAGGIVITPGTQKASGTDAYQLPDLTVTGIDGKMDSGQITLTVTDGTVILPTQSGTKTVGAMADGSAYDFAWSTDAGSTTIVFADMTAADIQEFLRSCSFTQTDAGKQATVSIQVEQTPVRQVDGKYYRFLVYQKDVTIRDFASALTIAKNAGGQLAMPGSATEVDDLSEAFALYKTQYHTGSQGYFLSFLGIWTGASLPDLQAYDSGWQYYQGSAITGSWLGSYTRNGAGCYLVLMASSASDGNAICVQSNHGQNGFLNAGVLVQFAAEPVTISGTATARIGKLPAEKTPTVYVDYENGTLAGLEPGAVYLINGVACTAGADGTIPVKTDDHDYAGTPLSIIRQGKTADGTAQTTDSEPETLIVGERQTVAQAGVQEVDGSSVSTDLTSVTVGKTVPGQEYSIDGGKTWIKAPADGGAITFTGKNSNTGYLILTRLSGTKTQLASEQTAGVSVHTPLHSASEVAEAFGGSSYVQVTTDKDGAFTVTLNRDIARGTGSLPATPVTLPDRINITIALNGHSITGASGQPGSAAVYAQKNTKLTVTGNGQISGGNGTNGGNGGTGITSLGTEVVIGPGASVQGGTGSGSGTGGDGIHTIASVVIQGGTVQGGTGGDAGGNGGTGIVSSGTSIQIASGQVTGGQGGTGSTGSTGGAGGNGITVPGSRTQILVLKSASVSGGNGGSGGSDLAADGTGGAGGTGGTGINAGANTAVVRGTVSGGNGGNGGTGTLAGGTGGQGGAAILAAGMDTAGALLQAGQSGNTPDALNGGQSDRQSGTAGSTRSTGSGAFTGDPVNWKTDMVLLLAAGMVLLLSGIEQRRRNAFRQK